MEKEDFRNLIIGDTKKEYFQDVNDWLEYAEAEFERIAKAIKWPVEKVRGFYSLFGIRLGIGLENEGVDKIEQ